MARFKVVVTDQVFPSVDVERELLGEIDAELEVGDGTVEDAVARGRDADALLNTYLPIDRDTIGELERCRIVARYGIGVDNIDLDAARDAGVVVTNVPDYCVEEVAAHALTLLLTLLRKVPTADEHVKGGGWGIGAVRPVRRLSSLTVGLVGYGKIARGLADSLRPLGCRIVAHDPYVEPGPDVPDLLELDELLAACDAVSLHAPLTPETRGQIAARELALMPDHAVLVNTSRGPLVVLDDLLDALRDGAVAGAALDVYEEEPPPAERLRDAPGLVATPHMAFYSDEAIAESQRKATTQIVNVLTGGEPEYAVVSPAATSDD